MIAANHQNTLMDRLRTDTAKLHERAEQHAFQKALTSGKLPQNSYISYLEQLLQIHRDLEARLRGLRASDVRIGRIVDDGQFQEGNLGDDLRWFGQDPQLATPGAFTVEFTGSLERLATERPLASLGCHYVLEGSKNGARFIAPTVKQAYGLTDGGARFLTPYGEQQMPRWRAFKEAVSVESFSSAEMDDVLHGANLMFEGIISLFDELHGQSAPAPASDSPQAHGECPHAGAAGRVSADHR